MKILGKLAQRNSDVTSCSPATIAFLGDSVTHGVFELQQGHDCEMDIVCDYEAVYHAQLKKMFQFVFPNAPINIINAGISGNSAQMGCDRVERDILPYSPDLVVVCFGLNDACAGMDKINIYVDALKETFKKLKDEGIEIIFMTPNMMNTFQSPLTTPESVVDFAKVTADIQNSGIMDTYMAVARKLCKEEGIVVCDCYMKWKKLQEAGVDTTKLLSNYINHPSREMHRLFAVSLFELIMFGNESTNLHLQK